MFDVAVWENPMAPFGLAVKLLFRVNCRF